MTLSTGLPSTLTMTSPDLMPAASAGLSGWTMATSAPLSDLSDRLSAISLVIGWIWTPSSPRSTRPLSLSCATIGSASDDGMAKPSPMLPPLGE